MALSIQRRTSCGTLGKLFRECQSAFESHIGNARRGMKQPCAHWIKSLLAKGTLPEIFEIEACPHGVDWEEAEQFWIANFTALGCRLLNLSIGGGAGSLGWRASEETKRRMRAKLLGHHVSVDTRKKIGRANRGRPKTELQLRLSSELHRGEKSPTAKLTTVDIPIIRALRAAGYSGSQVAKIYGVTKQNVDGIFHRETWSHVPEQNVDISMIVVPPIRRLRGLDVGTSKLDDDAVRDIRRRLAGKRGTRETGKALALEYGVTPTTISYIRNRKIWRHVA